MIDWEDHISIDADVMAGKPTIKGTRLTVDQIVELLERKWSDAQIIEEFPGITRDHIAACIAYADEIDTREAKKALADVRKHGAIPWENVKEDLGL